MTRFRRISLILLLIVCAACSSADVDTSTVDVVGTVVNTFNILSTSPINITLVGLGLTTQAGIQGSAGVTAFTLENVPAGEPIILKIASGGDSFSFPFLPDSGLQVRLGFIDTANLENLKTLLPGQGGNPIDDSKGIIIGAISDGQRSNITSVLLLDDSAAPVSDVDGPFFFEQKEVTSSPFLNFELSTNASLLAVNGFYVFFNVPENNYIISFIAANGDDDSRSISVLGGNVIIGQDIP